jgi:hypothetical protein
MLRPKQVYELGIADAIFEPADFLEQSLIWAAGVVKGESPSSGPRSTGAMWDACCSSPSSIARRARLHGAAPAAYKALELLALAKDAASPDGYAAEDEALADLIMGDELRSGLYAFDLVQKRAKRPAGAPDKSLARPVTKVGVVGAGLMASQLALLFARRLRGAGRADRPRPGAGRQGRRLRPRRDRQAVGQGPDRQDKAKARGAGHRLGRQGRAFADADFVIEAVFEDLGVKKQVFAELEKIVSPEDAILATNTSSLSVTEMAADLEHPERVVGFHFFNPVAVLPLLEIVRGEQTDDASLATAFAVGKS